MIIGGCNSDGGENRSDGDSSYNIIGRGSDGDNDGFGDESC